jgi:hypothetical protein
VSRPRQVAVIGAGRCEEGSEPWEFALEVGSRLAEAGIVVVCGGGGGVMEAAARGARESGGVVIGITQGVSLDEASIHCTHVVAAGVGHARNLAVVASGEAVIAIGGEWGTLSEIAFARRLDRTVAALSSWTLEGQGDLAEAPGVIRVDTAAAAVATATGVLWPS